MAQVSQLAAIMFTDIVGYTSLMRKDESEALAAIARIRETLTPLVKQYNGRFLKEIGDGTLSSFTSAVDAVRCAINMQQKLKDAIFKVRIGIHVGEVTLSDNDVFGDGVNIASRIEPLAPPGGVYITDRVYDDIFNKSDIQAQYVGERKLKNVDRPIKVYTLYGESLPEPPRKPAGNRFSEGVKNLWTRRVIQILLLYVVSSVVILQAVRWILDTYLLSPYWFDFTWILLLSLVPSVSLIAYYHGNARMDRWVRAERIVIPINLLISVFILFIIFQGKDLGAATREITVEDEQGNTMQRVVPKNEFVKDLAVFNFENFTDDPEYDWLSSGINVAIMADLEQDKFIQARGTESFYEELKRASIDRIDQVPFNLKRNIARELRMDYLIQGSYDMVNAGFQINMEIYESANGQLIAEQSFEGEDLFGLIDESSLFIKRSLQLPENYINNSADLPVNNILTRNLESFKEFILGYEAITYEQDYGRTIRHFRNAIEQDPDFIIANLNLGVVYMINNQMTLASEYIDIVMDKIYLLLERDQFLAKSIYYYINRQPDKRIKVIEMWIELYPEDIDAYNLLAQIYMTTGKPAKAEDVLKKALEIDDNRGNFYVYLAEVLMTLGKDDEALIYYQEYVDKYPRHARSFRLLGDYYYEAGEYGKAEENYEKAILISSNDVRSMGRLAILSEREGNFEETEKILNDALNIANTSADKMIVYNDLINYHIHRGEVKKAISNWKENLEAARTDLPPLAISMYRITRLYWYFLIDQSDVALQIIREEEKKLNDSFRNIAAFGYINYYLNLGDSENAEKSIEQINIFTTEYGSTAGIEEYYRAEFLFLNGKYDEALKKFLEFRSVNTHFSEDILDIKIAQCYLKAGKREEAVELLDDLLTINPYLATAHYEMAKILKDRNRDDEAIEHLKIADRIWENADPEYTTASEARQMLRDLTRQS